MNVYHRPATFVIAPNRCLPADTTCHTLQQHNTPHITSVLKAPNMPKTAT